MESWTERQANPVISIITVVYNSEKLIEKTLQSIVGQDYINKELIVIDGASKDRTLEIIKKYKEKISCLKSEPDKGIYDAMNKGIKSAKGDYIIFINSGDLLEENVLSRIFSGKGTKNDVFYGETNLIDDSGKVLGTRTEMTTRKLPKKLTWKSMKNGMVVSHQSFFVKRTLAPLYDLKYRFSADIDWVIECLKSSNGIINSGEIVSRYLVGGFSVQNHKKSLKERFFIYLKHYGLIESLWVHFVILIKNLVFKLKGKKNY